MSKATISNEIPTKVINENYDIFATFITENLNNMIENPVFPESLKVLCYLQFLKNKIWSSRTKFLLIVN